MFRRLLGVVCILILILSSVSIEAQGSPVINSFAANAAGNGAYLLSWNVANAEKVILNPGNIDVTGKSSYAVNPQSDTLYNLIAQSGNQKAVATAFAKTGQRLPRIHGLWIGPWYRPKGAASYIDDSKTVSSLKNDFGADMTMYNLDWLTMDYFDSSNFMAGSYQNNVNRILSFCQARIAEASSNQVYLFWQTIIPFEKTQTTEFKRRFLNDIRPCFSSPWVLGMHTIDEPAGPIVAGHIGVAWNKESLQEGYNLFKEIYPDKLVWYNEVGGYTIEQMQGFDWGDIVSIDLYVIPRRDLDDLSATMAPYIQKTKQFAGERDAWFIHQAAPGYAYNNNPASRTPTPDELRLLADLSWKNGMNGIVWWGMVLNDFMPEHYRFGFSTSEGNQRLNDFIPDENFKAALRKINSGTSNIAQSAQNNKPPIGWLDGITTDGIIAGWAYDKDNSNQMIAIHIYVDGPAGSGILATDGITTTLRTDVNNAEGIRGNHGFSISIPEKFMDGKTHSLYAYGIDLDDPLSTNTLLGGSPKEFKIEKPDPIPLPEPSPPEDVEPLPNPQPEPQIPITEPFQTKFGIFYSIMHCAYAEGNSWGRQIYDNSRILNGNGNWGPIPEAHYWGKPQLGYYCLSRDSHVLKNHAEMLRDAGIDFVYVDVTNFKYADGRDGMYPRASILEPFDKMLEIWSAIPNAPKIVIWAPMTQDSNIAIHLMSKLEQYPNLQFYYEGKPLLLAVENGDRGRYSIDENKLSSLSQKYTIRKMWALYHETGPSWSSMEACQNGFKDSGGNSRCSQRTSISNGKVEQIPITMAYQDSFMSDKRTAVPRLNGLTFVKQFETLYSNPSTPIATINSWNEWISQRFCLNSNGQPSDKDCDTDSFPDSTKIFTDQYDKDYSKDIEPADNEMGDFYYRLMKTCIQMYKGGRLCSVDDVPKPSAPQPEPVNVVVDQQTSEQSPTETSPTLSSPTTDNHPSTASNPASPNPSTNDIPQQTNSNSDIPTSQNTESSTSQSSAQTTSASNSAQLTNSQESVNSNSNTAADPEQSSNTQQTSSASFTQHTSTQESQSTVNQQTSTANELSSTQPVASNSANQQTNSNHQPYTVGHLTIDPSQIQSTILETQSASPNQQNSGTASQSTAAPSSSQNNAQNEANNNQQTSNSATTTVNPQSASTQAIQIGSSSSGSSGSAATANTQTSQNSNSITIAQNNNAGGNTNQNMPSAQSQNTITITQNQNSNSINSQDSSTNQPVQQNRAIKSKAKKKPGSALNSDSAARDKKSLLNKNY